MTSQRDSTRLEDDARINQSGRDDRRSSDDESAHRRVWVVVVVGVFGWVTKGAVDATRTAKEDRSDSVRERLGIFVCGE
jgi:hypothetical protein